MENQILLDKIGDTKSKNVIDDCYKIYKENFQKQFPKYFETNHTKLCSLVTATDKDEIKSIGMSCINDLLTDNYGLWLNAIMGGIGVNITLRETGNQFRTVRMWSGGDTYNTTNQGSVGTAIQVGTGTTPATRQDFIIENLALSLISGNGGYNSGLGKIDIPANNVATANFQLSETTLLGVWIAFAIGVKSFLLARDNISPVVSVVVSNTVNVDYALILSG